MPKAKQSGIPLNEIRKLSYSEEDGEVVVSVRTRGFLRDIDVRDTKHTLHKRVFIPDGKTELAALADRLRAHLDARGLPTDKTEVIPIELDWGYDPKEHGTVADEDLWFGISQDSTEPLTVDRLSAELLHAIMRLQRKFNDDDLSNIFRAMCVYHLYSAAGELNELATQGETSRGNLGKGPQVKKDWGAAQRKLILEIAREFWLLHPNLKGQYFNTAKKIQLAVNEARANQSLGAEPLAIRTISNQLRKALQEVGGLL